MPTPHEPKNPHLVIEGAHREVSIATDKLCQLLMTVDTILDGTASDSIRGVQHIVDLAARIATAHLNDQVHPRRNRPNARIVTPVMAPARPPIRRRAFRSTFPDPTSGVRLRKRTCSAHLSRPTRLRRASASVPTKLWTGVFCPDDRQRLPSAGSIMSCRASNGYYRTASGAGPPPARPGHLSGGLYFPTASEYTLGKAAPELTVQERGAVAR